jgi:CRP/FNR family transcriptional regulator, anaerobic regulatory protein
VESGMFQYYFLMDGLERTTYISIENTFIASLLSIITETPSQESVKALTDSSISLISKAD